MKLNKLREEQTLKQIRLQDAAHTIRLMIGVMALSLNNEYKYGKKRTNRLINRMTKDMACVHDGHLSQEDIFEWCKEKQINIG